MNFRGYCPECDKEVEYWVKYSISTVVTKKTTFKYIEKTCFCKECDSEIYIPDIANENCKRRKGAYRRKLLEDKWSKFCWRD